MNSEVEGINRTDESRSLAKARLHVVANAFRWCSNGDRAFSGSRNLVKVTARFVEEVGESAFDGASNLTRVQANAKFFEVSTFSSCTSLVHVEALQAETVGERFFFKLLPFLP